MQFQTDFDAVFVSKNFPERNMGVESNGNRGLLTSDNPSFQHFKVVQGLCGVEGTISFKSLAMPGYYLRHQGFEIYLRKEEDSDLYRKDSCFFPRYNKYFQVRINLLFKSLLCFYWKVFKKLLSIVLTSS